MRVRYLFLSLLLMTVSTNTWSAGEEHHPHHLAAGTGIAWLDSKSSGYVGVDYIYSWESGWGVGGFYEEVLGDFDLQVWGVLISRIGPHHNVLKIRPPLSFDREHADILLAAVDDCLSEIS